MRYPVLSVAVAALVAGIALLSYNRVPDDAGLSRAEQEAAANNPLIRTETETQANETVTRNVARSTSEPDLEVTADATGDAPADAGLLTVEGYDPYRTRLMLVDMDMPTEARNMYLQRLERAYGDDDRMAAILAELRAEIDASGLSARATAAETARQQVAAERTPSQAREVAEGIAAIEAILTAHDETDLAVVNDEAAPRADLIDPTDAMRPSFIASALAPENFEAERVVALIEAAPRLTDAEKVQLQTAVQAVIDIPQAQADVLDTLETILLTLV